MNIKELKLIENRFERKYTLLAGENWKFQNYLLSNGFIRTFDTRLVNSIYYDNDEKRFFHENIDGVSERIKTRLRWYNNDFTVKLELKKNLLLLPGSKHIFLVNLNHLVNLEIFIKKMKI